MPLDFMYDEGIDLSADSLHSESTLKDSVLDSGNGQSTAATTADYIDPDTDWAGFVKRNVSEHLLAAGAEVRSGRFMFPDIAMTDNSEPGDTAQGDTTNQTIATCAASTLPNESTRGWLCIGAPGGRVSGQAALDRGTFVQFTTTTGARPSASDDGDAASTEPISEYKIMGLLGRHGCWKGHSLAELEESVARLGTAHSTLSRAPTFFTDIAHCHRVGGSLWRSSDDGEWKVDVEHLLNDASVLPSREGENLMSVSEVREAFCQLGTVLHCLRTEYEKAAGQGVSHVYFTNAQQFGPGPLRESSANFDGSGCPDSLLDEGYSTASEM